MPGRPTFMAFHPKALNDQLQKAGLLAYLLSRDLPICRVGKQWYGVHPEKQFIC